MKKRELLDQLERMVDEAENESRYLVTGLASDPEIRRYIQGKITAFRVTHELVDDLDD